VHRRSRPLLLAALLALPLLSGCRSIDVDHLLGSDGPFRRHPWHQWPARAGMFAVTVPLTVVLLPVALLEDALTGSSLLRKQSPGVTSYLVGVPATIGASAVALPFYVLGLPWEFDEGMAPPPSDPTSDDDWDPVEGPTEVPADGIGGDDG
jgi:hypothetical protein